MWSYGILLYELSSLGEVPYGNLSEGKVWICVCIHVWGILFLVLGVIFPIILFSIFTCVFVGKKYMKLKIDGKDGIKAKIIKHHDTNINEFTCVYHREWKETIFNNLAVYNIPEAKAREFFISLIKSCCNYNAQNRPA